MKNPTLKTVSLFLFSILVCQLAGFIGSFFTIKAIPTWYALLNKPSFNPPNRIFAPVWTVLYLLMGIALFLILSRGLEKQPVRIAVGIFAGQLILNALWSIIFFGLRNPFLAFVEIIFLWFAILAAIIAFSRLSRIAAILLIPYLLWVTFAAVLNFYLWNLNPGG